MYALKLVGDYLNQCSNQFVDTTGIVVTLQTLQTIVCIAKYFYTALVRRPEKKRNTIFETPISQHHFRPDFR